MNIREELQRHLIETNQVMQTRRYKWLCAIALALSLIPAFHVLEPEFWQMRRLRKHIEEINPQWDAFKRAHPGFEAVELFPEFNMSYGVSFAAKGTVPWPVDLNQLAEFMSSTKPPFSVDIAKVTKDFSNTPSAFFEKMSVVTIDGKRVEILVPTKLYKGLDVTSARSKAEPGSPANGSHASQRP
jgi:hypothetical protein